MLYTGLSQNNCMNGNFQEKRISADSDYGQQSSGKMTIDLFLQTGTTIVMLLYEKMNN